MLPKQLTSLANDNTSPNATASNTGSKNNVNDNIYREYCRAGGWFWEMSCYHIAIDRSSRNGFEGGLSSTVGRVLQLV